MRGAAVTELYFWDGWQCVVEATTAGAVTKEYVYGEGIDEVLKARLPDAADIDSDLNTSEKVDLYYHQNSLGSVVAVTDSAGDVVESYRYSPYGEVSVFDASGSATSGNVTLVEQPFMFTGRRWDFEEGSGLYYYRLRYYDPVVGRFVSRDPLGMWGDESQKGSAQNYCGNDPVNSTDAMGLGGPGLLDIFDGRWTNPDGSSRPWYDPWLLRPGQDCPLVLSMEASFAGRSRSRPCLGPAGWRPRAAASLTRLTLVRRTSTTRWS